MEVSGIRKRSLRKGVKKKHCIDHHFVSCHLGTPLRFVGIGGKKQCMCILLKCEVSRMESKMEVSRAREEDRVFIVSLGYYINNTVLCHLGFWEALSREPNLGTRS